MAQRPSRSRQRFILEGSGQVARRRSSCPSRAYIALTIARMSMPTTLANSRHLTSGMRCKKGLSNEHELAKEKDPPFAMMDGDKTGKKKKPRYRLHEHGFRRTRLLLWNPNYLRGRVTRLWLAPGTRAYSALNRSHVNIPAACRSGCFDMILTDRLMNGVTERPSHGFRGVGERMPRDFRGT